jgi:hypothetical protein
MQWLRHHGFKDNTLTGAMPFRKSLSAATGVRHRSCPAVLSQKEKKPAEDGRFFVYQENRYSDACFEDGTFDNSSSRGFSKNSASTSSLSLHHPWPANRRDIISPPR